ncbi:FTR1 family iron permease [Streptomyces albipurpureus]|uniref:FTR1 family protein n=1 Tax=Streptomyces albipurpureus TaxID=2897419 RepID=A0ABT0USE8_9ACTN|nr:FTR1 family protein [Streptomyces sp. CWNU-1]MCM2390995.1 FTR1 family protein [Streptomyces sp. CWNU-1]
MYGTYLMGLRTGLEAGLIASLLIVLAIRTGRRAALPAILLTSGIAIALSLGLGSVLEYGPRELTPRAEGVFGGFLSLAAAVLVGWVVLRARHRAPRPAQQPSSAVHPPVAAGTGTGVLASTAALAVAHEGMTAALFFWSAVRAASEDDGSSGPLTVLLLGIATAAALVWVCWRTALRITPARSLNWLGTALLVLAAGVAAKAVGHLQLAQISDGVPPTVFSVTAAIPPDSWYGTLLTGVFGFVPDPTVFQITVWALYLIPTLVLFHTPVRFGRSVGGKESAADEKADSGGRAASGPGAGGSSGLGGDDGAGADRERMRDGARRARDRSGGDPRGSGHGAEGVR